MTNLPSYEMFLLEGSNAISSSIDRLARELAALAPGLAKELEANRRDVPVDEIALSLALSAPTLIHLSGLFLEWLGHKYSNRNLVVSIGRVLDTYGFKLQSAIYKVIELAIKPLISHLKPSDQELAAKCLFASLLATRLIAGLPTISSLDSFATLVGKVETALIALDTREIVTAIREVAPKLAAFAHGAL